MRQLLPQLPYHCWQFWICTGGRLSPGQQPWWWAFWGACGDREISMAMRSVFTLLSILTQSTHTCWQAFTTLQNSKHTQTQPAASSVAYPEAGMPSAAPGLPAGDDAWALGHWEAGGEVLMPSSWKLGKILSSLSLGFGQNKEYLTVTRKPRETSGICYINLRKNWLVSKNELKKGKRMKRVLRSRRILKKNME